MLLCAAKHEFVLLANFFRIVEQVRFVDEGLQAYSSNIRAVEKILVPFIFKRK